MKRIRISGPAKRDLEGIWRYLTDNASGTDAASQIIDSIVAHFALLARQPQAGRTREDIDHGVRSFPTDNYLIYYRESRSHLVISRVLHSKRDQLGAWNKPAAR